MSEKNLLSLRRRVGILLTTSAILALLALSAGIFGMLEVRSAVSDQVDKYDPAAIQARNAYASAVNQETAVRGYILTGRTDFLDPYPDAIEELKVSFARLHELLDDEPEISAKLKATEDAYNKWRINIAEPQIASVKTANSQDAFDKLDQGKAEFDAFRVTSEDLRDSIRTLRSEKLIDLHNSEDRLMVLLGISSAVLFLIGVAIWVFANKWITQPIESLARDVRLVASGQLKHEVQGWGPPELQNLASDVEAMRKRIIQELVEVSEARSALNDQAEELARSNADLEQFAYVASHDLQEPLRKVASFCQLLEQRYSGQLDERGQQYIDFAVDGAKRMQQLINDLLSFSRVGRNVVNKAVDLNESCSLAISTLQNVITEAQARVVVDDLPTVCGDPTLLAALFQNLIGNAVKFRTPERAPEVKIKSQKEDDEWVISVSDNGIGIEEQYAEKIFIIFQRLHARDEFEGTGIGLSLCKKIVEHHGGRIWLDTQVEHGATVHFALPVMQEIQENKV